MTTEEIWKIREWAPVENVFQVIPMAIQQGIHKKDLNITCIDAVDEFYALGSNIGVVYWYDRQTGDIQKLKTGTSSPITCVKIVDSVQYMVAAGNDIAQLNIFAIQKKTPPDLMLSAPCTKEQPIKRYTVKDLHQGAITCCEWSKNGMKLYSGDNVGMVVLTEIDYKNDCSIPKQIVNETYKIVQLSAYPNYLLVCSTYRSIVWQTDGISEKWTVTQIGTQYRKQLADCGGTFFKNSLLLPYKKPTLVCGRPNLRLWLADTNGNVEKTMFFNEIIKNTLIPEIPLLNPKPFVARSNNSIEAGERTFRSMHYYGENQNMLVTHDEHALYILNLTEIKVEAVATRFRNIIDFCVFKKEIFVLEGGRSLTRLASSPEKINKTTNIVYNPKLPPQIPKMGYAEGGSFEAPIEYEPKDDDYLKLPPLGSVDQFIDIDLGVESLKSEQKGRAEIFNEIAKTQFDENIVHHSARKKRNKNSDGTSKSLGIVEIGQVVKPDREDKKENSQPILVNNSESYHTLVEEIKDAIDELNPGAHFTDYTSIKEVSGEADEISKSFVKTDKNVLMEKRGKVAPEAQKLYPIGMDASFIVKNDETSYNSIQRNFTSSSPAKAIDSLRRKQSDSRTLAKAYPKENIWKSTSIQTTPQKKDYYIEDNDFTYSQPVEDLCAALRSTNINEVKETNKQELDDDDQPPKLFIVDPLDKFLKQDFFSSVNLNVTQSETTSKKADKSSENDWEVLEKF